MYKKLFFCLTAFLPLLLSAAGLSVALDFSTLDPAAREYPAGWGTSSAPGYPRLPVKTVNIVLPPGAENISYSHQFLGLKTISSPPPLQNPPFANSERTLSRSAAHPASAQAIFGGIGHWGDVAYARFSVLPAIHTGTEWQIYQGLQINLSWTQPSKLQGKNIPPVWKSLAGRGFEPASFFANPEDLAKYYSHPAMKNYDYLIVSTPELYSAIAPLESYRQDFITAFADIATILSTSPGISNGEKLRNYLVSQYNSHPFSYLLLVGDYDTVPVMYLTPEPDGGETIASDFFYGDLSSIIDTDGDGRLGEYSPADGLQDFLCDFTPEVFVGRISTNSPVIAAQIATRTVAFEQSNAPWKHKALLPAAYLNYGGEPDPIYLQTDGATFMEFCKATVLSDNECTTMYEQIGFLPSFPSDLDLNYSLLKNELNSNSYGLLSWSAHGSSSSSSRKVWMNDDNGNNLPDSWEMDWLGMVDRQSFDNLANSDGMIVFAGSCYNGMIDASQQCLAEYALQKKAVAVTAATRTGWYKIGWTSPGWGGILSYNYHWLENLARNQLSVGAAQAWTNLIHTQYYLFGDPVDDGGIIYPELQNVYTNILYGDPAIGHIGATPPLGDILVYEPMQQKSIRVVDTLIDSRFNVIYTDKLITDYEYINQFEAVFCLFGWGDDAYQLSPGSLEYNLLNSYLAGGGKLYLEGDVAWDPADPFWGKFATYAPLDNLAYIGGLQTEQAGNLYTWDYNDQADPYTQTLVPYTADAEILFTTSNQQPPDYTVGILNATDTYATVASSFALADVDDSAVSSDPLYTMLAIILDKLGVMSFVVDSNDQLIPVPDLSARAYPNPFGTETTLTFELCKASAVQLDIYNLRGQKICSLGSKNLAAGSHELLWDGTDHNHVSVAPGIYFWRLNAESSSLSGKMLKLAN